jgi:alkylhydroperoxidase/carboxymuconolactone decarboxylase family protein YurZ
MEEAKTEKRIEEYLKLRRETWGEKALEDSGLEYLAKVAPKWFKQFFIDDFEFDLSMNKWPRKYWELMNFSVCAAIGMQAFAMAHGKTALENGATREELLDCMFFAGHARSHSTAGDMLHELRPIMEAATSNVPEAKMSKRVEEYIKLRREAWGEKALEELGFEYVAKVAPQWLEGFFIRDVEFDLSMNKWPMKYWELIIFSVCAAIGAKMGATAHAKSALKNGATGQELLDCMFFAGHACSHSTVANMLYDLKPMLEEAGT